MLLVLMVSLGYQAILGIPVIHASHIFKLSSDDYFYLFIKDLFSFNLFVSWTREEFPYISYFVLRFKFCSFFYGYCICIISFTDFDTIQTNEWEFQEVRLYFLSQQIQSNMLLYSNIARYL